MRHKFTSAQEAHDFAYEKGMPFNRLVNFIGMNSRMLTGLRVREQWVLGIYCEYKEQADVHWVKADREYFSLDSFRLEYQDLKEKMNLRIIGFYCYQLKKPESVIHLEDLNLCPLSTQLYQYTGDEFSLQHFHDESDTSTLTPGGTIVHRDTNQSFFVPAADISQFK